MTDVQDSRRMGLPELSCRAPASSSPFTHASTAGFSPVYISQVPFSKGRLSPLDTQSPISSAVSAISSSVQGSERVTAPLTSSSAGLMHRATTGPAEGTGMPCSLSAYEADARVPEQRVRGGRPQGSGPHKQGDYKTRGGRVRSFEDVPHGLPASTPCSTTSTSFYMDHLRTARSTSCIPYTSSTLSMGSMASMETRPLGIVATHGSSSIMGALMMTTGSLDGKVHNGVCGTDERVHGGLLKSSPSHHQVSLLGTMHSGGLSELCATLSPSLEPAAVSGHLPKVNEGGLKPLPGGVSRDAQELEGLLDSLWASLVPRASHSHSHSHSGWQASRTQATRGVGAPGSALNTLGSGSLEGITHEAQASPETCTPTAAAAAAAADEASSAAMLSLSRQTSACELRGGVQRGGSSQQLQVLAPSPSLGNVYKVHPGSSGQLAVSPGFWSNRAYSMDVAMLGSPTVTSAKGHHYHSLGSAAFDMLISCRTGPAGAPPAVRGLPAGDSSDGDAFDRPSLLQYAEVSCYAHNHITGTRVSVTHAATTSCVPDERTARAAATSIQALARQ